MANGDKMAEKAFNEFKKRLNKIKWNYSAGMAGGKRGGVLFVKGQEPMVVEENLADRLIELARKIAAEKAGK